MSEDAVQLTRLGGFAAAFALAWLLQRMLPHSGTRGSAGVNGALWLVNVAVLGSLCGACVCSAARWAESAGVGLLNHMTVPAAAAVPLSILFLDLVSYCWHRANHRVGVLWRLHQVHHSDPAFTVTTALRFHPGELLLSLPLRLAAVVLLGVPVVAVVVFEVLFTAANAFEHGDIELPAALEARLSRVVVTPALHRRHHIAHATERDSNFATIFSVWDRLLGSYAPNGSATRVETGLPGLAGVTLADALSMPVRRARW